MGIRALPILSPCQESFASMRGDGAVRSCARCEKDVHDLSAMTEPEARAVLERARGTRICVRYAKDDRGLVRFRTLTVAAALAATACSVGVDAPGSVGAPPPAATVAPPEADEGDHDMGDAIVDETDLCPDVPDPEGADGCPGPK